MLPFMLIMQRNVKFINSTKDIVFDSTVGRSFCSLRFPQPLTVVKSSAFS